MSNDPGVSDGPRDPKGLTIGAVTSINLPAFPALTSLKIYSTGVCPFAPPHQRLVFRFLSPGASLHRPRILVVVSLRVRTPKHLGSPGHVAGTDDRECYR